MANANSPFGLEPVRLRNGSPWSGYVRPYYVKGDYNQALYLFDPVVKTGTSNTAAINSYKAGVLPEINLATAGTTNPLTGVIVGFEVQSTGLSGLYQIYNSALTERVALVCDNPELVCKIQASSTTAIAATDIGLNANLVLTTAGSTVTGLSGAQLDSTATTGMATTIGFQLKILGLANIENNDLGTNAILEVSINQHTESNNTAGI